jgi:enoyl-CoA hydratase/carnithine racemase
VTACIRVDRVGGMAARITLDRPEKRNALSIALRDGVSERSRSWRGIPRSAAPS